MQGYIFLILQHFATKLCNFTNFDALSSCNDGFYSSCLYQNLVYNRSKYRSKFSLGIIHYIKPVAKIACISIFKIDEVLVKANKELIEVARRSEPSVLRQRSYDGMSADSWMSEVLEELATRCPIVNNILMSLVENNIHPEKKNPAACLIYGIVMFLRCHELSRIQRINSVLLIEGHAAVNVSNLQFQTREFW
jgi:hypothetical protein